MGTERGISLDLIPLVGTHYFMMIDYMAFELLNPDMPGPSFSLKKGTEKEIILPYAINPDVHTDVRRMQKDPPDLQLSEYPRRKLISLR